MNSSSPTVWLRTMFEHGLENNGTAGKRHTATDTLGLGAIVILVPLARQSFTRSV